MSNKSKNKFNFISSDELENEDNVTTENEEVGLHTNEFTSVVKEDDTNVESTAEIDNTSLNNIENEEIKSDEESRKEIKDNPDKKYDVTDHFDVKEEDVIREEYNNEEEEAKTKYFGFGARVVIMVLIIIVLFVIAGYFIIQVLGVSKKDEIQYHEKSTIDYKVCSNSYNVNENCYEKGLQYNSNFVDTVKIDLNYKNEFSDSIKYDLSYYVDSVMEIYDDNDTLVYSNNETLKEKTPYNGEGTLIDINESLDIDYKEYRNLVLSYYVANNNITANLTLRFTLNEGNGTREVGTITIPFTEELFGIKTNEIDKSDKIMININEVGDNNIIFGVIAGALLCISLIFIYRLTHLILKVTNTKNEYQQVLEDILREYDRIIVVARDGYESNVKKDTIKVSSFEELLDARDALEKPIIFSKINNVKSEFIVEDDTKLYKYILKEADIINSNK